MRELKGASGSVWALTRSGFAGIFRNAFFWIAASYAGIVVTVALAMVLVPLSLFAGGDESSREFLINFIITADWMLGFIAWLANIAVVIVVAIVGTRTVSRDRMLGGLEFILSKAIPPWGYVIGRASTPVFASLLLLFVPILVIALLLQGLVDDLPAGKSAILWGAVAAAAVTAVVLGILAAGLGSLVSQPRRGVVLWLLIVWATLPLSIIAEEFGAEWSWLVGPLALLSGTTRTLVDLSFPGDAVWQGWLTIVVLVALSLFAMRWRVREVVR